MGLTQKLGTIPLAIQTDSSNNVGIGGAANASYKLALTGASLFTGAATFSSSATFGSDVFTYANGGIFFNGGGSYTTGILQNSDGSLNLQTGGSIKLKVTSSGNVAIGTTNTTARFNIQASTNFETATLGTATGTMGYLSANGLYGMYVGIGNSGNTWLQSQRNDGTTTAYSILLNPQGGDVGIGTTSPSTGYAGTIANVKLALRNGTPGASNGTTVLLIGADDNHYSSITAQHIGGGQTYLAFGTSSSVSNPTERMRITSAGNLDFNFVNTAAAYVQINQATNQDGGIVFKRNLANRFQQTLNSGDGMQFYSYGISTTAFVINYGGSASLYGALTQNASDRRLKNNIQNIPNALDKINAINGVTFEWDNTIYKTDRTNDVGIIAQEVQAILPEAVTLAPFDTNDDGTSKSGENYLTAYYEKLIPLLIEGIKELSAKVTALENK